MPDLFLFARTRAGDLWRACFVEVKKPEEPVSEDQRAELDFLRALELEAGVLRLREA